MKKNNEDQNFNCLEFKWKLQEKRWKEYQAQKDKFASFSDYLDYVDEHTERDPRLDEFFDRLKKVSSA